MLSDRISYVPADYFKARRMLQGILPVLLFGVGWLPLKGLEETIFGSTVERVLWSVGDSLKRNVERITVVAFESR